MSWLKLKAGALQLTLFIIVIIVVLLMTFILLIHTHKQFRIQSDFKVDTVRAANLGINFALHNQIRLEDTTRISLEDEDYKSLKVCRNFWGAFERVTSVSQLKNNRFQKSALIGSSQKNDIRSVLYVQDNDRPLILVGNTKIEGLAYLPKQGVKSGTISGQSYNGSQLIYGKQNVSNILPKLDNEMLTSLKKVQGIHLGYNQEQFLNLKDGQHYSNSFLKPLQIIFSNDVLNLTNVQLTGHILIQSRSKIVVHYSAKLTDVILVAPEIEIQNNVIGSFQAIASNKIIVENNVELNYPSALIVNEKEENNQSRLSNNQFQQENGIVIGDKTTIKGQVVYLGQEIPNNYKVQIEIKEQAILFGELYCNQNTELKGKVYGTVYTNNFLVNKFGSIYQNHLYDATINIKELPQEYVGLSFLNSEKKILKWLY